MKQPKRYVQRFLIQSTVLLLLMSVTAFLGVYASGRAAYRSANELGSMTADYLNLQVDSFLEEYAQILGDAAHTVEAMLDQGMSTAQVEQWLKEFSDEYASQMNYDESGFYGSLRGQPVYTSGWVPDADYDATSRPWYRQAVASGATAPPSSASPCSCPTGSACWLWTSEQEISRWIGRKAAIFFPVRPPSSTKTAT